MPDIVRLIRWLFIFLLCHIYSPSHQTTLATSSSSSPLTATWVTLPQRGSTSADGLDGLPLGRCDHGFQRLGGAALRPNQAVPFTNGIAPSTDPYAGKIWLYGGHQDAQYNDTWLLDLNADIPTWTQLHSPAEDGSIHARWGTGLALIPNGLVNNETGLTGLIFGGQSNEQYLGDVSSFNFADKTQSLIMSELFASSDTQPFARGYVQWVALPGGSGSVTGVIDNSTDSGLFYMFGGNGASNGIRFSDTDHDWGDEWIYSLRDGLPGAWMRLGSSICVLNSTVCSDAASFTDILTGYMSDTNSTLDFSALLRPEDIYADVQLLINSISALNLSPTNYTNDPTACQTSCAEYAVDTTRLTPPFSEGSRMAVLGDKLYQFGGYECTAQGVQTVGGDVCYTNDLYIMDLLTFTWSVILAPNSTDFLYDPNLLWPSRRAYHNLVADAERELIWIEGGAYQDTSGTYYYYNDVYAFHVPTQKFIPLVIHGTPPPIHWSAGWQLEGEQLVLYGGCQGATYYNQLMALVIGLGIQAQNCYAFGDALSAATAGVTETFYIQTREFSHVFDATSNKTHLEFGANATYGTGLTFSAQAVTSDSGSLSLVPADVRELGAGLYQVRYTATTGSNFRIFIYYEGDQIPGSPYAMTLHPEERAEPTQCSASGWGTNMTVKGDSAQVVVQMRDEFHNQFTDNTFMPSSSSVAPFNFSLTATEISSTAASINLPVSVVNNLDGTFTLDYTVPSDISNYLLSVILNDQELSGSPYIVVALDPIVLPHSLVVAFWCLSLLSVAICLFSAFCVVVYSNAGVVRSSSPNFLLLLILGSIISSLSVIFLVIDLHDWTCQAFHSFLSIGLVTSLVALLAKSHRVARIFNTKQLKVQRNNTDLQLLIPTAVVILLMVLLNVLWIGINPMKAVWRPSSNSDEAAVSSFKVCSGENVNAWLGAMIAFCGAILLYGVYLAVKTGHVPEQFNESKVIAGSIYNIFFCTIIIVPLLFFIGNNSTFLNGRIVIESLIILWCSLFTVFALIGPKVFLIWSHALNNLNTGERSNLPTTDTKTVGLPINSGLAVNVSNAVTIGGGGISPRAAGGNNVGSIALKKSATTFGYTASNMPQSTAPRGSGSVPAVGHQSRRGSEQSAAFLEPISFVTADAGAPPSGLDLTQPTRYRGSVSKTATAATAGILAVPNLPQSLRPPGASPSITPRDGAETNRPTRAPPMVTVAERDTPAISSDSGSGGSGGSSGSEVISIEPIVTIDIPAADSIPSPSGVQMAPFSQKKVKLKLVSPESSLNGVPSQQASLANTPTHAGQQQQMTAPPSHIPTPDFHQQQLTSATATLISTAIALPSSSCRPSLSAVGSQSPTDMETLELEMTPITAGATSAAIPPTNGTDHGHSTTTMDDASSSHVRTVASTSGRTIKIHFRAGANPPTAPSSPR